MATYAYYYGVCCLSRQQALRPPTDTATNTPTTAVEVEEEEEEGAEASRGRGSHTSDGHQHSTATRATISINSPTETGPQGHSFGVVGGGDPERNPFI